MAMMIHGFEVVCKIARVLFKRTLNFFLMLILMQPLIRIMNNNDGRLFPARKENAITNLRILF